MLRWDAAKATSAWKYLREVFFRREGTKPQDYAFTSMGISDMFHGGDGMKCGATGIDDSSCSNTGRECEDLNGKPRPDDVLKGTYPASFIVLNSIANFNNVGFSSPPFSKQKYVPLFCFEKYHLILKANFDRQFATFGCPYQSSNGARIWILWGP